MTGLLERWREKRRPPESPERDVGRVEIALALVDEEAEYVTVRGYWFWSVGGAPIVIDAEHRANDLIRTWNKDRVAMLGNGVCIPIHRVKRFHVSRMTTCMQEAR